MFKNFNTLHLNYTGWVRWKVKSGMKIRRGIRIIKYVKKDRNNVHITTKLDWELIQLSTKMRNEIVLT